MGGLEALRTAHRISLEKIALNQTKLTMNPNYETIQLRAQKTYQIRGSGQPGKDQRLNQLSLTV